MTLCPYALVLSCGKCPIKAVCPLKGVIGDAKKPVEKQAVKDSEDNNES